MRLLVILLCWPLWAGAATWHLCPDTDASNTDLNYGTENGTSQENCFDGFAAAAAAGTVAAGDTIYLHGTFYNERGYAWISGTASAPIIFDGSDSVFWFSVDVSGSNTTAKVSPFGQSTGSAWQLVSGTTDVWKKGAGVGAYKMWVDGIEVPPASAVPATQDDAGAIASLTGTGQYIMTTEDLDTFDRSLYYRGSISSDMRVNTQSITSAINATGGFVVDGYNYISLRSLTVRGYRTNVLENANVFIQNCTGCAVTDLVSYEGEVGLRSQNNTGLSVSGTSCHIHHNIGKGVAIGGQRELSNAGSYVFISAISKANPAQIDTVAAHGLTTGEKVVIQGVSGMTQINSAGTERTVTVVDGDSFTIPVDSSAFSAYTSGGQIWVARTDAATKISDCLVENNGNVPVYNGSTLNWNNDADGLGVGYYGGTVNGLVIQKNRFLNNGPRRAPITGESGDALRGSGVFVGTSFTFSVQVLLQGNDFYGNHRYSAYFDDVSFAVVAGNLFRGMYQYGATASPGQVVFASTPTTRDAYILNNVFDGASGIAAIIAANGNAGQTFDIRNNIFSNLTFDAGTGAGTWKGAIDLTSTTGAVTEGSNKFFAITPTDIYSRNGTGYATVAAWQAVVTPQGANDEIVTSAPYRGGSAPSTIIGFFPSINSTYLRSGADANIGNYLDAGGRAFLHPPSIGAWEVTSGDMAASRTAATARTAASDRTAATARTAR